MPRRETQPLNVWENMHAYTIKSHNLEERSRMKKVKSLEDIIGNSNVLNAARETQVYKAMQCPTYSHLWEERELIYYVSAHADEPRPITPQGDQDDEDVYIGAQICRMLKIKLTKIMPCKLQCLPCMRVEAMQAMQPQTTNALEGCLYELYDARSHWKVDEWW